MERIRFQMLLQCMTIEDKELKDEILRAVDRSFVQQQRPPSRPTNLAPGSGRRPDLLMWHMHLFPWHSKMQELVSTTHLTILISHTKEPKPAGGSFISYLNKNTRTTHRHTDTQTHRHTDTQTHRGTVLSLFDHFAALLLGSLSCHDSSKIL